MNRELIRQKLIGTGPFIIRTSNGDGYTVPHSELILVGRYNIVIEGKRGLLDILDPHDVVSVRRSTRRKLQKAR
jgi:hypothetical protein